MDHLLLSCIDSKIENNQNLYGCFQLGTFNSGQAITIANAMRRTLLSELTGFGIVCVEIQGVNHEYSNIKGVRESVLDILLNLKKIIFIANDLSANVGIGFLKIQGPAIVKSCDLKLPSTLKYVDPNQYIATLSNNSYLEIKFMICKGKNFVIQTSFDLITEKFYSYFYDKQNNKKNVSIIKKQNLAYLNKNSTRNFLNLIIFNANFKKLIHNTQKNTILIKSSLRQKKYLKKKQIFIWRQKYSLKNKFVNNFLYMQNKQFLKPKSFIINQKLIMNLKKKFFYNFENIILYSNLNISNFQLFKNLIYKQNLKKKNTTGILLVDPVFMPIRKVNFSIQNIENFYRIKNKTLINKFQKKTGTEKIILEIWTNGSIDPKNALYKATQKIIEMFIPFQKIYLTKKMFSNQKNE